MAGVLEDDTEIDDQTRTRVQGVVVSTAQSFSGQSGDKSFLFTLKLILSCLTLYQMPKFLQMENISRRQKACSSNYDFCL